MHTRYSYHCIRHSGVPRRRHDEPPRVSRRHKPMTSTSVTDPSMSTGRISRSTSAQFGGSEFQTLRQGWKSLRGPSGTFRDLKVSVNSTAPRRTGGCRSSCSCAVIFVRIELGSNAYSPSLPIFKLTSQSISATSLSSAGGAGSSSVVKLKNLPL